MENTEDWLHGFDSREGILLCPITGDRWFTTDDMAAELILMLLDKIDVCRKWVINVHYDPTTGIEEHYFSRSNSLTLLK